MSAAWAPALYAALVWWFATGIILYLDRLAQRTFRWSMLGATVILLLAAYGLRFSADEDTVSGAYIAFSSAILIWGWLEMSFLLGFLTGPRRHACHEPCRGWAHFVHATQAIIYNEIATALGALAIYISTLHAANREALFTFLILWSMRLSAKLNLFLGVPNLGDRFLPEHLQYLKTFFARRSMNLLFPVSITGATMGTGFLLQKCLTATSAFQTTGFVLLTSLVVLGLIEHWFMVLPLPNEKLWQWALKQGHQGDSGQRLDRRVALKSP